MRRRLQRELWTGVKRKLRSQEVEDALGPWAETQTRKGVSARCVDDTGRRTERYWTGRGCNGGHPSCGRGNGTGRRTSARRDYRTIGDFARDGQLHALLGLPGFPAEAVM